MTIKTGGIRAGQMRRPVTIQHQITGPNGTQQWVDLFTNVRAEVQPLTGSESVHQLGPPNVQATQLNIRYRPGVKVRQRVVMRNRMLDIVSVINQDEANVQLTLMCREAPVGG